MVLDLPPGTGDVQLTICQDIDLSGAVGVTTPSKLALADARKGIEMFSKLGIKTMAMVENMAYFDVRHFQCDFDKTSFVLSRMFSSVQRTQALSIWKRIHRILGGR